MSLLPTSCCLPLGNTLILALCAQLMTKSCVSVPYCFSLLRLPVCCRQSLKLQQVTSQDVCHGASTSPCIPLYVDSPPCVCWQLYLPTPRYPTPWCIVYTFQSPAIALSSHICFRQLLLWMTGLSLGRQIWCLPPRVLWCWAEQRCCYYHFVSLSLATPSLR